MNEIAIILLTVGVGVLCLWGWVFITESIEYLNQREYYANLIDNIYICSESPEDDSVLERAKIANWWLKHVGNEIGVKVLVFMYRDHKHLLEAWEEYELRRDDGVNVSTKKLYKEIVRKYGQDYFNREVLGQKGIVYPEQKEEDVLVFEPVIASK